MKNITVTVSDELYHEARVRAARSRTTITALVREYLQQVVDAVDPAFVARERAQRALIARIRDEHPGFTAGTRLSSVSRSRDAIR